MAEQWGNYNVEYALDGKKWVIPMRAMSEADAKRRLDRAAAFGSITGPWQSYPLWRGWWVPAYCWVRNKLARSTS